MTSNAFDAEGWVDRLAGALRALAKVQEPYLQTYWERHTRKQVIVDGRDETPFPLDDLRMVYSGARHSRRLGTEPAHAPLSAVLDPTRHALLLHPELERVAVTGRSLGENDFWMRIMNRGTSIWAGDLIAGLMARAAELPGEGFRSAANELNALLSPLGDCVAAAMLGDLNEGFDLMLFYGVTVTERIEMEDGMAILPVADTQRFVERKMVDELAPSGAGFHEWRSVGALGRPFRWRPLFRPRGSLNDPARHPSPAFFADAQTFLDLIAISHAVPVVRLANVTNCIDLSAARLLGQSMHDGGTVWKQAATGFGGFSECPALRPEAFDEAREAYRNRDSERFRSMVPLVTRLAEALSRDGRVAMHDKVVDVAIALEGMYELPRWKKSRKLEKRVSGFLGTDAEDRRRIAERVAALYEARSEIVHSDSGNASPFRDGAAFVTGFDLARRSLFKLLREGVPENWNAASTSLK